MFSRKYFECLPERTLMSFGIKGLFISCKQIRNWSISEKMEGFVVNFRERLTGHIVTKIICGTSIENPSNSNKETIEFVNLSFTIL